jgi:hypothetical protein
VEEKDSRHVKEELLVKEEFWGAARYPNVQ